MSLTNEKEALKINGIFVMIVFLATLAISAYTVYLYILRNQPPFWGNIAIIVVIFILMGGFCVLRPNEALVMTFLGRYIGTIRDNGFWFKNPFASAQRISLKIRNFESTRIKVNDAHGNPIEIACVVTWKVFNSYKALFDVEDYVDYVSTQAETAVRTLASHYPYDAENDEVSLRGNPDQVSATLRKELSERLSNAGIQIIDARLTHLAYSPEIAQAMLRKQQAQAIISARQKIVEGAVTMVEMALNRLSEKNIVELDNEKKAIMVNNLLVTLVSESETKPVINTGTIY